MHRRNAMRRAKFHCRVAVPEIEGIPHVRRPPILRLKVQQILRILDQHFHTREVHVHFLTNRSRWDKEAAPENAAPKPRRKDAIT